MLVRQRRQARPSAPVPTARVGTPARCAAFTCVGTLLFASATPADTIHASFPTPQLDRWMYPFNATPGTRPVISTFGSTPGAPEFDSRDGQFVMAFATGAQVPSGLGATSYTVTAARVTIEYANDLVVAYDPTQDSWRAFVAASDPEFVADSDTGQPIELFGCGFRSGFNATNFLENSSYSVPPNPMAPGVRTAFAASFDSSGALVDVSNSPRQRFDPLSFGIGKIDSLAAGSLVPINTPMHFDLDVSHASIQQYLREALDRGRMFFVATSLTFVEQQGGSFPAFYAKEHSLVPFGLAHPAKLELTVVTGTCASADINCDGLVNGFDLSAVLSNWGAPGSCDINGDGITDGFDLSAVLSGWSG